MNEVEKKQTRPGTQRSLGRMFVDDLRSARMGRDHWQELKDLYYFYLDADDRARLARMGRFRRAFMLLGWLFKSLLRKLSPGRRLMLLLAFVFTVLADTSFVLFGWGLRTDFRPWAILILVIVLMLELKDKLVARDEIQIAREVQLALLPRGHPSIPGWSVWCYTRPANDVGGDLVDYLELDGFRHGVVLGDVAGKGLGAALLSAKLQATLRALVPEAASLDDLGHNVNTIFNRDGISNRFATLFYLELEYHSGQMRYLNAGHNPAFLVRPGELLKLGASSWPVGMLPDPSYEECTLEMDPGDLLVVYSDGLTEATNVRGEEYGEARVERLVTEMQGLAPHEVGDRILREVDGFIGDSRLADDLSLVIVVKQRPVDDSRS